MYCVKCGVELADSEKHCPLCQTKVVCPEGLTREVCDPPYPKHPGEVTEGVSRGAVLSLLSLLFAIPFVICLLCDLNLNGGITWAGYVMGALALLYVQFVFPYWFRRPNPVIFAPVSFAALGLYLLYISLKTEGGWFLSLAFPVVVTLGLIVTAVVTLTRYLRGGRCFIYGGALCLFGFSMIPLEWLICLTFGIDKMFRWSLYPFAGIVLIGAFLLLVGICRPLREALRRMLFF